MIEGLLLMSSDRFLTLEQLKKGVDQYRESGGTLL